MASYNQIGLGSTGDDVKRAQEWLNSAGDYNLDVDGIFGTNTQNAVRDYQSKNGLDVDGIVGNNTWASFEAYSSGSTTPSTTTDTTTDTTTGTSSGTSSDATTGTTTEGNGGFTYSPYEKSDVVTQAENLLDQHLNNRPGAYQSSWQTQIDEVMDKILNREDFSYDLNGDALYQQYKDQYTTQGRMAMMDTMGQAAALTGGYGNSYAQTVGQQTYQGYLQQLNDKVPELYQLALDQYNREGDALYNQYGLLSDRENQDYGKYRDSVSDYYTDRDYYTNDLRYQSEQDYNRWIDQFNIGYGMYRDNLSDEQWQKQFNEGVRQFNIANGVDSGGSSGSSSGGDNGNNNDGGNYANNGSRSESQVRDMQLALGVEADGKWGPATQAAAQEKWGITSADDAWTHYTTKVRVPGGLVEVGTGGLVDFTGTTYSEAVAFANDHGVPNATSSTIMTQSEWRRAKASGGTRGYANQFDTYPEYLAYTVETMITEYGN